MKTEKIKTVSGNDLLKMDLPDLKFPVEGFLPQGLHILSGLPKAGKSWMLLLLCLRVSEGEPFWLYQTNRGTVLYLCLEDSFNRIQQRLGILTEDRNILVTLPISLMCLYAISGRPICLLLRPLFRMRRYAR